MWCVPAVNGACVARMEDVIDLYAEDPHPKRPVGLFRREPGSAHRRSASADPSRAGTAGKLRLRVSPNGTVNLFVALDAHRPWRKVTVAQRRPAADFAQRTPDLGNVAFPDAANTRGVREKRAPHP